VTCNPEVFRTLQPGDLSTILAGTRWVVKNLATCRQGVAPPPSAQVRKAIPVCVCERPAGNGHAWLEIPSLRQSRRRNDIQVLDDSKTLEQSNRGSSRRYHKTYRCRNPGCRAGREDDKGNILVITGRRRQVQNHLELLRDEGPLAPALVLFSCGAPPMRSLIAVCWARSGKGSSTFSVGDFLTSVPRQQAEATHKGIRHLAAGQLSSTTQAALASFKARLRSSIPTTNSAAGS